MARNVCHREARKNNGMAEAEEQKKRTFFLDQT